RPCDQPARAAGSSLQRSRTSWRSGKLLMWLFLAAAAFTFTGTIWHADGKIHYVTSKFTCVDANTSRSVATGIDQDGKAIPKVIKTFKRIK
ncbi:MAG: hypothetical protein MK554_12415, partial [Planctomycetes bacterium]|nr:hypothetical protein [Planctomycetota bacterium]